MTREGSFHNDVTDVSSSFLSGMLQPFMLSEYVNVLQRHSAFLQLQDAYLQGTYNKITILPALIET